MTTSLFWLCLAIVVYTYVGYGLILYLLVFIKRLAIKAKPLADITDDCLPEVTLMVCAYNEEDIISEKMSNTHSLDYPADRLHLVWVTDGSTDNTNSILSTYPDVKIVFSPERRGKSAALKHGIKEVYTEIVMMTDANTMLNPEAVREIVRLMQDPKVGCVSGEKKVMAKSDSDEAAQGEGLYWKYESALKRLDSELYSAMGAAGELCVIRRQLMTDIPDDTLLDDFVISMEIVRMGYKIAYTSKAFAMEYGSADLHEESKRKRRIAAGGLQSSWRLRSLMNPLRHPVVAFQFVSHRVLRWTITPVCLFALIPLNTILVLSGEGIIYTIIWILQILFYASALAGMRISKYFVFMNLNVFRGMAYLLNNTSGTWEKAKRA
ncbi:MAG: glycosyltransferase family 2 protein [Prevotella sp.]|nr:glycosyltransferase family 2 protein [Prevotella sp.]MDD7075528.1 glycosyltransferase family 2 protein [Prevotellaceae bacterium]MDY5343011.1 glycosyltransferase family 2 protein [Prevotella sp.]